MAKYAYREGLCDGLLGRDSQNPYTFTKALSMEAYQKGYFAGASYRREHSITLKVKRESA